MDWSTLRKIIYLSLVEVLAFSMISTPVYALSNYTGYVRVLPSTAVSTYVAANAPVWRTAVATAALAPTVASTAIRLVSGPVGWGALAVTAGLTLAQMYYSAADLNQVKADALAAQPTSLVIPGYTTPAGSTLVSNGCSPLVFGCQQIVDLKMTLSEAQCQSISPYPTPLPTPTGWSLLGTQWNSAPASVCVTRIRYINNGANNAQVAGNVAPTTITQPVLEGWMDNVPVGYPLKPANKVTPVGTESSPTEASSTTTVAVTPTDIPSSVKKVSDVLPTDTVVNPNVPPPVGDIPQPATVPTTSTTTTATVTNPDGTVTQTQTDQAAGYFCSVGNHDQRSMGSILTDHMNVWKNVGILGTLNNLKNIVWPSALPTYTFGPTALGTFTLNFSTWAWAFADVRSIMIATSGLYGVVIVFRGRASS